MNQAISLNAGVTSNTNPAATAALRQFLLFRQGESYFAVELIAVREVLCLSEQPISLIPNTQPFLLGLTNLRGEILAVGDFGHLIASEASNFQAINSRILIMEAPDPQDIRLRTMRMGLAVAAVEGVIVLNPDQIVSAVEVSAEIAPFLKGLYDCEGRLVMILDVEAIAQSEQW